MKFKTERLERERIIAPFSRSIAHCNTFFSKSEYKKEHGKKGIVVDDGVDDLVLVTMANRYEIQHFLQNSFQSLEDKMKVLSALLQDYGFFFLQNLTSWSIQRKVSHLI